MAFCGLGSRVWGLVKVWGGGTQEAHVSRFRVRVWSMGSGLRVEKEEGDLKKRVEQKGVSRLRVYLRVFRVLGFTVLGVGLRRRRSSRSAARRR